MRLHRRPGYAGVLATLFDFSFSEFITLKMLKVLYALVIAALGLLALLFVFAGFQLSFLTGVGSVVGAGVLFLLAVTLARIWLEAAVVFFRIAENTAEVAEHAAAIAVSAGTARTTQSSISR